MSVYLFFFIELCANAQHSLEFSLLSFDCSAPMPLLGNDNLSYRNINTLNFSMPNEKDTLLILSLVLLLMLSFDLS